MRSETAKTIPGTSKTAGSIHLGQRDAEGDGGDPRVPAGGGALVDEEEQQEKETQDGPGRRGAEAEPEELVLAPLGPFPAPADVMPAVGFCV